MANIELKVIEKILENLRDFGYEITIDYLTDEVNKLETGVKPTNIIGLMAKDMLVKNDFMED